MARPRLGLDVGGTNVKGVLLGGDGGVRARARWKSRSLGDEPATVLAGLEARVRGFLDAEGLRPRELGGIGLACAGLVDFDSGRLEDVPNLVVWEGLSPARHLSRAFGIPVHLENDVNALTYGEWRRGAGRGTRHLVCLALGTGVGGGLILDGRLYRGHRGFAAELGHMTIESAGRRCACGNRGCLEAYAGAASITRAAARAIARRRKGHARLTALLAGAEPEPAALARAARAGSALARELMGEAGRALGVAIASYVNIFAPERVLLAGGVSRAGRLLLDPARAEARPRLMNADAQRLELRLRALGDDGAAIGAALLAGDARPRP